MRGNVPGRMRSFGGFLWRLQSHHPEREEGRGIHAHLHDTGSRSLNTNHCLPGIASFGLQGASTPGEVFLFLFGFCHAVDKLPLPVLLHTHFRCLV